MKIFIAFVICLAFSRAALFLPTEQPSASSNLEDNLQNLNLYFNALWGYFNLSQSEAASCFSNETAFAYFQLLQTDYQMAGAFMTADKAAVGVYATEIVALNGTVGSALTCLQNTDDYLNLLQAAGYDTSNMTLFQLLQQIYFQAHNGDWYLATTPAFDFLNEGEYSQFGSAYAPIMVSVAQNSSIDMIYLSAIDAFHNGNFYYYNLSIPFELPLCYDEQTGQLEIQFLFQWAQTVANSTVANVVENTNAYMQGEGRQLLQQLQPVIQCEDATNDQEAFNNAVGYDVHSSDFHTAIGNYINNNPEAYWALFNTINTLFLEYDPFAAGIVYGEFYSFVAASI